ncbi:hypothetical protein Q4555_13245 [Octadecabacter sp. 1_MG-2023]|uniref:hypothetical protein n=1 Tax=unclassified Octadecabacter TaxID=196158 RepID=UPI001C091735|nr:MULTISPECIES: hypothetical protein [unclassified Octadecabacter]MBU2993519.1 hypothetical protein [Octadecabacter sp. B2R22]MDO6735638.1 hypothetical protein [Octadecabacter sp. 1_MG-2023]
MTKIFAIAALLSATTTLTATAGGMGEPVMEPHIIVQEAETSSSSAGLVPLMVFVALVAVASAN